MFQTIFAPSADEVRTLLGYVQYLWEHRVVDQMAAHPLYAPSALWKQWAGQTFTGFSLEKIILQGGHAFPSSVEVGLGGEAENGRFRWRRGLGMLLGGSAEDRGRQGRDPAWLQERFNRFYPQVGMCPEHERWYAWHPNPYFRCREAYVLREKSPLPMSMLEVGGGACVNVAFYHSLNPKMHSTIVDLPETVMVGYCFLKTVFPEMRIELPHEAGREPAEGHPEVRFLLPTQAEMVQDGSMDFCFNMSSFQEMTITTVNHYLRFMCRKLKPGGTLLSVNLETSRYLEGNALKNYDFAEYHASPRTQPAPFGTDLVGHIQGLRMVHTEVTRKSKSGEMQEL